MIRLRRLDAVLELADKLAADAKLMANRPELAANIAYLRSHSLRR